jgi:hypothetical protein
MCGAPLLYEFMHGSAVCGDMDIPAMGKVYRGTPPPENSEKGQGGIDYTSFILHG